MKKARAEAIREIDSFFSKNDFSKEEVRKIKRLAMKHKILLKDYRKKFCKKCFSNFKSGSIRIEKGFKVILCECGYKNRWKIKTS